MEQNKKVYDLRSLPGGRRGAPRADAGCLSSRDIGGGALSRRAPASQHVTAGRRELSRRARDVETTADPMGDDTSSLFSSIPSTRPSYMTRSTSTLSTTSTLDSVVQDVNLVMNLAPTQSTSNRRRRWTPDMNKFILRTYLQLTALDTDTKTYLEPLHLKFIEKYPDVEVSRQRLGDQRRAIVRNKLLSQSTIDQIYNEVKEELDHLQTQTVTQTQTHSQNILQNTQTQQTPPNRRNTTENTQQTRIKWTNEHNETIMRSFYQITNLDTNRTAYRKLLHENFICAFPALAHLSIQRIADQKRAIINNKYIDDDRLNIIKQQVSEQLALNHQNHERSLENPIEDQQAPVNNDEEFLNNILIDLPEEPSSNSQTELARQHSIDETFQQALEFYKITEPTSRTYIPKQKPSKKLSKIVDYINNTILPENVHKEIDFHTLQTIIYCAAWTAAKTNGARITLQLTHQTSKINIEYKPRWQKRLELKVEDLRTKIARVTQFINGNRSRKLTKHVNNIMEQYKNHSVHEEPNTQPAHVLDTLKQKLSVISSRLHRYTACTLRKQQNTQFAHNEKQFYRNLKDTSKSTHTNRDNNVNETPDKIDFQNFWSQIWEEPSQHNAQADWIGREVSSMSQVETMTFEHIEPEVFHKTVKSVLDFIKTQVCTIALSLTLFNSVRLPKEAFSYGPVPYLVVYSFWLLAVGLPTTLLQLAMGQLSQQDPVGVWRAVPMLRGVGHLKLLTSYLCCIYYMMYAALSLAYLIWIGKGTFPLKDCTRLHITPRGYENRMNASECFNSTFLAPFAEYPQYLGIMAILIFVLWFFVPILLYRLRKSLKVALCIMTPLTLVIAVTLSTFLAESTVLDSMFESCEQWKPLSQPYIWHSACVQVLLSTQIAGGYLVSAGGSVYRHSDVRWTSASVIMTNIFAGWLWVLLWESIGGDGKKDTSFISILVLIYQSSVSEKRAKEWPILAFGIILASGIITVLTLLFPIYDKLHRLTGDNWRLFASASSALGTALTVVVLARGLDVAAVLDNLVIPVLAVFTAAVEIVGFVFIYGWCYLTVDIEFLTGVKLPCFWVATWWTTPVLLLGVTGWWLRALLRATWGQTLTLWPLLAVMIVIIFVMVVMAAVAVAKEEQYNLASKISAAFRPSRLWGPEEPMARYVWMSQRYVNEVLSTDKENSDNHYSAIIFNKDNENKFNDDWLKHTDTYQRTFNTYTKNNYLSNEDKLYRNVENYSNHNIPRGKKRKVVDDKFRSPNICIAKGELGGPMNCNCNRHFTLNVPDLSKSEVTTSL